jgi:hypothetical protein
MTKTCKKLVAPFVAERLDALSKGLADTNEGLTGSEINHLLRRPNVGKVKANHSCIRP